VDLLLVRLVSSPSPGQVLLITHVLTGFTVVNLQEQDGALPRLTAQVLMLMDREIMVSVLQPVLKLQILKHSASETTIMEEQSALESVRLQNKICYLKHC